MVASTSHPAKERPMIYLVAGLDHNTFSRWHDHVAATDPTGAARDAIARAARQGIELVVAAVIGPYGSVEPFVADAPPIAQAGRPRAHAA
jgi:hypothetical protein